MPITEDTGNQPAAAHTSSATTVTTASFSPQAGTLLVAMIATDGDVTLTTTAAITDSLSGTWTLLKRQNTHASATLGGTAEVWCRYLSTAPGSMTVTGTWTSGLNGGNLVVRSLLGASSTQPGVTAGNGGLSIAPTATLTPSMVGSWVYGMIIDGASNVTLTANAQTTIIDQDADATVGDTWTAFKGVAAVTALSSTTYGFTDGNSSYNIAIAEILPTASMGYVSSSRHPGRGPVPNQRMRYYTSPSSRSTADGAVFANAASAEGFGYAYGLTDHSAGLLLALAGGQTGTAQVQAQPTEAAGTGTAYDATVTTTSSAVSGFADVALGTGSAYDATVAITASDGGAAGTGTAADAQAAVSGQPTEGAGTGTALTAGTDIAGTSGVGTGSGVAGDPQASVSGLPTEAPGTGTGQDAQGATGALPGAASGTGASFDTSVGSTAQPTEAAGTGTALDAASSVATQPTNAAGVGQAYDVLGAVAAQPPQADGTGTSQTAADDIQVFADWAGGQGVAYDAAVTTSGQTNAPAAEAVGTGTAYDVAPDVQAQAGVASGSGTAFSTVVAITVTSAEAIGSGLAYDASAQLPQSGTPTVVSGREAGTALSGREGQATFTGTETGVISGRQPLSSTSGTESTTSIHGRES